MADSGSSRGEAEQGDGDRRAEQRPGLLMGRAFGIPVYVSPTWFLVAIVITIMFQDTALRVVDQPLSYVVAFIYAVLLYASVFLHELSHSVVARLFGLPVRAITLHILGGVSEIEREPGTPGREFLIAVAGPLASLGLAVGGYLAYQTVPLPPVGMLLVEVLTVANLIVGIFNLLPGLPLDGGRLIRAGVWKLTGRPAAGTMAAGWIGRGVAVLVVLFGMLAALYRTGGGGPGWLSLLWAVLIASFIWVGAGEAIRTAKVRERIPLLRARGLARRAVLVAANMPLAEAIRRANEADAGALVVVDHEEKPVGLVSEKAVLATPEQRRPWIEVGSLSRALDPELVLPADIAAEEILLAIRRTPATEYLLVEPDGEIFGVLATEDVNRSFVDV